MPRTPGVHRSQAKADMYWFAHGGIESAMNQRHPVRSTTPGPGDTEDESSESGSLSLKINNERRATSEEPVSLKSPSDLIDNGSNVVQRLNFSDKRQAVEERKRLLLEAEQEKNDAILKKHTDREAAFEARRNAQRSNISFAFGSTVPVRQSETDGGRVQRSPDLEKPKILPPTTLYTLPPKTVDVMSQSMFSPTSSARGRRKNDLTPTIPYDRTGPPRTAPPTRKRSVSMSRLDQLAQPRKAYVEAQKANSTISNSSSKDARQSPTRPLSVASDKLLGVSKTTASTVTRRPPTASRKPRPVSIAGTIPDHVPQEKKTSSKSASHNRKSDVPVSTVKTHTSHLRARAKSSSAERTPKPTKTVTEKQTPPKPKKSSTTKSATSKQSSASKLSSSPKQWTPKTSPARKLLTNKKQAAMLVSTTAEGAANTFGEVPMQSPSPARSSTPDDDSQSADERGSGKRIISEEEAKASLAEKRRLAREQAEKEAELERQRQEALRMEEEERLRLEEEEHQRMEEEQLRMLEEHSKFEEEKLRKAIEEQERKEEEEKSKREEEARFKAEQEKKAKEEAEKQRIELEEKKKKEEEERAERKKRLEKIMSRTRGKSGTASPGSGSGSEAPDSTESQPEILSSEPNSLDSNIAVESLPMDHPPAEEPSASESYDYNQTMNLDSHSLSSNDLMMSSSGHTSLEGSIPIVTSEHASLENQQAEDPATKVNDSVIESEGEEVSSSSTQPVTELTLTKAVSENVHLDLPNVDPGMASKSKDTLSVDDQQIKTSIEDDTLVSNVQIDAISETSSGWHADEEQRLAEVTIHGEDFDASFINESQVTESAILEVLKDSEQDIENSSIKTKEFTGTTCTNEHGVGRADVPCTDPIKVEDSSADCYLSDEKKYADVTDFVEKSHENLAGSPKIDSEIIAVEDAHLDYPSVEISKNQVDAPPFLNDSLLTSDKPSSISEDHEPSNISEPGTALIHPVETDAFASNITTGEFESSVKFDDTPLLTKDTATEAMKTEQNTIVEESVESSTRNVEDEFKFVANYAEESTFKNAEESTIKNAEESTIKNAEELTIKNAEESTIKNAEESTIKNAEESTIKNAEESTIKNAEESTIKNAEESTIKNAEESTIKNAEESTIKNAEESTIKNAEESTIKNAEESTIKNAEESTIKNAEESTIKNAEESTIKNAEESTIKNAEESTIKNAEESTIKNAEEPFDSFARNAEDEFATDLAKSVPPPYEGVKFSEYAEEIPPPFDDVNMAFVSDDNNQVKFGQSLQLVEQEAVDSLMPKQEVISPSDQLNEFILLPDPVSDMSSLLKDSQAEDSSLANVAEQASSLNPNFEVQELDAANQSILSPDQNVLSEVSSSANPFASDNLNFSSQAFESNRVVEKATDLERFADHGVLKTVDEMNYTNLEETNKNAGFLFSYAEEVPVDVAVTSQKLEADAAELPLAFQQNLPGETLPYSNVDQSYEARDVDMASSSSSNAPNFDTSAEQNKNFMTGIPEDVLGFGNVAAAASQDIRPSERTLNPFGDIGDVPKVDEQGFFSSKVISEQVLPEESSLANELLMNAFHSAIEESEDSSLDSNLSQVLNVETTDPFAKSEGKDNFHSQLGGLESSPSAADALQRDTCDTQQFSNSAQQQEENVFIPKTNGFNATFNNVGLYGDRFESVQFGADQIPVLPKDQEQGRPISENGMNANISTVGNGNVLDNVDNVNSNKITSNPFLISSDTHSFPANPFEIKDDKTVPTYEPMEYFLYM